MIYTFFANYAAQGHSIGPYYAILARALFVKQPDLDVTTILYGLSRVVTKSQAPVRQGIQLKKL